MRQLSPQSLRRLTYFAAIAEAGSIRGAAERLGLSVPVVSEALAELEAEMDVSLATRNTRSFALTDAGRKLQITAAEIVHLATQALQPDTRPLDGRVALTLPVELAANWIAPHLARFQAEHPSVRFEIDASDQVTTLALSPYDIAIRTAYLRPGDSAESRPTLPLLCIARNTPQLQHNGTSIHLPGTALIGPSPERGLLACPPNRTAPITLTAAQTLAVNNRGVAISLVRQGLGVTLVVAQSVTDLIAEKTLTQLLPDHDFGAITLDITCRDARPSPAARAFAEHLRQATLP